MYASRPYAGPADLRSMQRLVSRSWALEKPQVNVHIGDLEWWIALEREEPDVISLWFASDELVGWAWLSPPAELDAHVHVDHRDGPLFDEMLDWLEVTASQRPATPEECVAFQFDPDAERRRLMESRGYRPADHGYIHHVRSLTDQLPDPAPPRGSRCIMCEVRRTSNDASPCTGRRSRRLG